MAFDLELDTSKTVEIIVSKDSAVGCDPEEYEEYLKDLDESRLQLKGEPTRFVMKKVLPYRDTTRVMNSQMTVGKDGQTQMNLSFMLEEVRLALIGIKGSKTELKKDGDGGCSKEIVNELYNRGVLMDLYNGRRNASGEGKADELRKKSLPPS